MAAADPGTRRTRWYPTRRLLALAALTPALALAGAFLTGLSLPWQACLALGLAALLDRLMERGPAPLGVVRDLQTGLPLGVWSDIPLRVANTGRRDLDLRVHDHVPPDFETEHLPLRVRVPAEGGAQVRYRLRPLRRCLAEFAGTDLVFRSPLGLWERVDFIPAAGSARVLPNIREIARYSLLATDNRLSRMGVRRRLRRGEGADFHQLREFRTGDALRQIDWRATSRLRKLISKEYQDARDQQVVFLLDCGRRMRHADDGERTHLDDALNALLLLAYVAARQGDAVGLLNFGGERRWLAPRKGGNRVQELLRHVYDLESTLEASDYLAAARQLLALQRRRALVILLTNTRDEDYDDLTEAVRQLRRRHLVVLADLREQTLDRVLESPVAGVEDALRFQGVSDYLDSRRRNHEALQHGGALTLDLLAEQLPAALVNQYLDVKASGAL